ncbi:MAG: hypothetical protein EOP47_04660 [Sphingobacteriaceae bacterium]|nr:MAG: hypothetical protein EOP47_04660 [Sphingobacteriaceae bacterium]
MKNHLLTIISIVLLTGCHLKKKTSEINTIDLKTVLQTTEDVKTQTNLKVVQIDSSKIVKSSTDNLNYSQSVDLEFDLIPNKETSILIPNKSNTTLFEQLLSRSKKVKIYINHIQQKSNIKLLTQQNNIKSNIDSAVSKVEVYKNSQKTAIREKNILSSETQTYTVLAWCFIAVGILITIYLLNKFNIFTLIVGVFK